MKILILCTGNSCRSQIAEGFLKHLDKELNVYSAGINPATQVNPFAVQVMKEIGIDISNCKPKNVGLFLNNSFDYVITVCDNAKESCPTFGGEVKYKLHFSFEDPANAKGSEENILNVYRNVRDEIIRVLTSFYNVIIKSKNYSL